LFSSNLDVQAKTIEGSIKSLTNPLGKDPLAYYETSFSPAAGFFVLGYEGPGVPWRKVVKVGDEGRWLLRLF
jgi:dipeptidyl aminopeptidase